MDDLTLSTNACETFFRQGPLIVEEKIDGANLAFRRVIDEQGNERILVQNRSRYISSNDHSQFSRIHDWVSQYQTDLLQILTGEHLILYGEWCAARHTISYDRLPGLFVAFDMYDSMEHKFYSRARFHQSLSNTRIPVVPTIGVHTFSATQSPSIGNSNNKRNRSKGRKIRDQSLQVQIQALLERPSAFATTGTTLEGVVLRRDQGPWLLDKAKMVRPDFTKGCAENGHWFKRPIVKQRVDYAFGEDYLKTCLRYAAMTSQTDIVAPPSLGETKAGDTKPLSARELQKQAKQQKEQFAQQKRRLRCIPPCIMLMGLPGAGKSTFARRLQEGLEKQRAMDTDVPAVVIASQDTLGRRECERVASSATKTKNAIVVVDRCHLTSSERNDWMERLQNPAPSRVTLICFSATAQTCLERVQERPAHPTLKAGPGAARIVHNCALRLELPNDKERRLYGSVHRIETAEQATNLLTSWGCDT